MKKLILLLIAALLAGPLTALVAVAVLVAPTLVAQAACPGGAITVVTEVPESLAVTALDGQTFTLGRSQLGHARTIIQTGAGIDSVELAGIRIALMAGLTESTLRMLANSAAYPESTGFPNDGDGGDHDSLGVFQMRPQSGWGTVAELMGVDYQARAFFGGPDGPNSGSPRGLLDIPGWSSMDPGEAAQSVEVSAYPDRYQNFEPVAASIMEALILPPAPTGGGPGVPAEVDIPATTRIVMPLPAGTFTLSDPFGMREDPLNPGATQMHRGTDYAAADGTAILAMADGVVRAAGSVPGWGNLLVIEHNIAGEKVVSLAAHMWDDGFRVQAGDRVSAGQHVADVGSSGRSTGPHLHFEVHPGGWDAPAVDAAAWLAAHGAEGIAGPSAGSDNTCRLLADLSV